MLGDQLAEARQERSDLSMIVQQLQLQVQQTPPHVQKEIDELRAQLSKGMAVARESAVQLQQAVNANEDLLKSSSR
jgi:signal transduction histidine kinase